eukprot:262460_1
MSCRQGNGHIYTSLEHTKHSQICIISVSIVAVLVGAASITQSGINIALASWTKHPLRASFIQCIVASIILFPLCFVPNHKRTSDANNIVDTNIFKITIHSLKQDKKNYFVFLNGFCAVIWVCTAIYMPPRIGFGLFAISAIFGQIFASLLLDQYGLLWNKQKELSLLNIFGSVIVICGVVIFQFHNFKSTETFSILLLIFYILIVVLAGIALIAETALNRQLQNVLHGTPYQAAFVDFVLASLILFVVNIVIYISNNDWFEVEHNEFKWYIFCGGILAVFVVTMYIICPSYIGFVAMYIYAVCGSLVISLIYDTVGTFGQIDSNDQISIFKISGAVCVFFGAVLSNIKRNKTKEDKSLQTVESKTELEM